MMEALSRADADVFVPDGTDLDEALARTTHLGVGAHQDDLELLAAHGIVECHEQSERWFTGVVVTDGRGSPRPDGPTSLDDEAISALRRTEQRRAAALGRYSAQLQLGFPSQVVKSPSTTAHAQVVEELRRVLAATRPEVVYTHNLADKHDTHVAVSLRLIEACRRLPASERPQRVIGCEVWRDLDWLLDQDKVVMPVDEHQGLQAQLLAVFESQISAAKRYDLAGMGRRRAHATFFESHQLDRHSALVFGMDLTPLLTGGDPASYVERYVERLAADIRLRIARLGEG
jgi:LmbE family N-acetylglucosaminyl deacetylase